MNIGQVVGMTMVPSCPNGQLCKEWQQPSVLRTATVFLDDTDPPAFITDDFLMDPNSPLCRGPWQLLPLRKSKAIIVLWVLCRFHWEGFQATGFCISRCQLPEPLPTSLTMAADHCHHIDTSSQVCAPNQLWSTLQPALIPSCWTWWCC